MAAMLVLGLYFMLLSVTEGSDPCVDHQQIYDTGGRSPVCPYYPDQCDRYIRENWYKVVNNSSALQMPTKPIPVNSCGASNPIWLNGSYSSETAGIVNMKVCLSTVISPCDYSYNIQVKNCGHFFVFHLKRAPGCPYRYCFGTDGICPTSPEDTTHKSTKTSFASSSTSPTSSSTLEPGVTEGSSKPRAPESSIKEEVNNTACSIITHGYLNGNDFAVILTVSIIVAFLIGGFVALVLNNLFVSYRRKARKRMHEQSVHPAPIYESSSTYEEVQPPADLPFQRHSTYEEFQTATDPPYQRLGEKGRVSQA